VVQVAVNSRVVSAGAGARSGHVTLTVASVTGVCGTPIVEGNTQHGTAEPVNGVRQRLKGVTYHDHEHAQIGQARRHCKPGVHNSMLSKQYQLSRRRGNGGIDGAHAGVEDALHECVERAAAQTNSELPRWCRVCSWACLCHKLCAMLPLLPAAPCICVSMSAGSALGRVCGNRTHAGGMVGE